MAHGHCSCGLGLVVAVHRLSSVAHGLSRSTVACGILVLLPGIEPPSPALQGRFLTTGSPGKPQFMTLKSVNSLRYHSYSNINLANIICEMTAT